MKRIATGLAAVAALMALGGCVGYVPVPVGVGVNATYHDGPAPRAYRDRDGDGVPNRMDRRPGNPYRY